MSQQTNFDDYEPSAEELLAEAINWITDLESELDLEKVKSELKRIIRLNLRERKRC